MDDQLDEVTNVIIVLDEIESALNYLKAQIEEKCNEHLKDVKSYIDITLDQCRLDERRLREYAERLEKQ